MRSFLVGLLLVGVVLALGAPAAVLQGAATTFTVTKTADTNDGTCDADCSLREAITDANANAGTDTIAFAIPGAGPHTIQPTSALPTITDPVIIDGYTQPGASANTNGPGLGLNTVLKIELDGTNAGVDVDGLKITAGSSTIRGLAINRFLGAGAIPASGTGIHLSDNGGNVIEGNFIGTDVTGSQDLGNARGGVEVDLSSANTVGGTSDDAANLISGNKWGIILAFGSSTNLVQRNLVGTDITGTVNLGNDNFGITLGGGTTNNTIGGTTPQARNVISGNGSAGINLGGITSGNVIRGNFIGTNVSGTGALGNGNFGLYIQAGFFGGPANNTIGGTTPGGGNVISGNGGVGIFLEDDDGQGTSGNLIQGNLIGTDLAGTAVLGNGSHGVWIRAASDNAIGGSATGAGNHIAHNGGDGVFVESGTANAILGNSILSNTGLGIDLSPNGSTPNDAGDGDTGANNLQNFPVLTSAVTGGGTGVTVVGTLDSTASAAFRVEFFANSACDPSGNGEGETFLGAATATTDGSGTAVFVVGLTKAVSPGALITATATDPANNTSEFSACQTATAAVPLPGIGGTALAGLAALLAFAFAWTARRRARVSAPGR